MRRLNTAIRIVIYGSLAALVLFAAGFFHFLQQIPTGTPRLEGADGIVVLTGAAFRIQDAVALLEQGRGRRLLITGVHPATTREALSQQVPDARELFACCIDIGHYARNTIGNAAEATGWARRHGFSSLIVVTSNYHLPRSLAEFSRAMPGTALIPYPVVADSFRERDWWAKGEVMRVVLTEYVKYVAAVARQTFIDPGHNTATASPAPGGRP